MEPKNQVIWTTRCKMFLSENVIFQGLRLSLGHFGQQVPDSPVYQLQNNVLCINNVYD